LFHPLYGCTGSNERDDILTIATFNIAWLGDGKEPDVIPRTQEEIATIADVINETSADIIALQEIENIEALNRILALLPQYSALIGKGGNAQNVGFLHKKSLSVKDIGEYAPIAIIPSRNRPGYVIAVKKGSFDCTVMSVHFKSTSRYDSTDELRQQSRITRREQSERAVAWLDSLKNNGKEQDVFIIGDFNDFPKRAKEPTLQSMVEYKSAQFLTEDLKSCKYQQLFGIDHIYASTSAAGRYVQGSRRVIDIHSMYPKDIADKVSDHCPVIMQFDVSQPDND